jgi:hypothetical protein
MVVADGVLTNILINRDIAFEGNPLLLNIAGGTGLIIAKIAGVILAVVILWDIRRRYPRVAFWTSAVFLLIYCGIVFWNLSLLILA